MQRVKGFVSVLLDKSVAEKIHITDTAACELLYRVVYAIDVETRFIVKNSGENFNAYLF